MYYARLSWIITYLNQTHISKSALDIYFNVGNLLAHLLLQKVIRHFYYAVLHIRFVWSLHTFEVIKCEK